MKLFYLEICLFLQNEIDNALILLSSVLYNTDTDSVLYNTDTK